MLHWTRHWASVVVGSTEQWPALGWSQHQSSPLHHDQHSLAWQLLLSAGAHLTCNYCLKTHQLPMLCCHELYWMVFCWVGRGGQLGRRGAMCVVCWRELVHWSHSSTTHWPAGKWIKTDSFHYFRRGNILINNFTKPVRASLGNWIIYQYIGLHQSQDQYILLTGEAALYAPHVLGRWPRVRII